MNIAIFIYNQKFLMHLQFLLIYYRMENILLQYIKNIITILINILQDEK